MLERGKISDVAIKINLNIYKTIFRFYGFCRKNVLKNKGKPENKFNCVEIVDKQQLLEDFLNEDNDWNAIKIPIKLK